MCHLVCSGLSVLTCTLLDDFLNLTDVDIGIAQDPPLPDSTASADQGEAVEAGMCDLVTCTLLDDFLNLADVDIGVAPDPPVPDSTASADLTWMGMDPHISDSEEPDKLYESSESDSSSCSDLDQDSDSDSDSDKSGLHPAIKALPDYEDTDNSPFNEVNFDEEEVIATSPAELPAVITKLRAQLLAGYTHPNHPPIDDSRGRSLTESEELSLKHFMAWVESRGTVKGYSLHAKVLQQTTNIEILSLYLVRKLVIELTGLSSQLVDMCPKSCMAFTGEFKNLRFCIYVRQKGRGPCGQPRYNKKNQPIAQMLYTPIIPFIQSLYKNRETAEAMRYRHIHLQEALQKLEPGSEPDIYSDFSDSIGLINQVQDLSLFQKDTDTAITISGDGAQLTMKKQSDVWVLIVTILNLPPNMRTKAANIIMPLTIPGPSSPGNIESFVYVLYEELAKLSVGVWTEDILSGQFFLLKVYLCGVLGDMLGSAKLSKMAGHMALHGCRFSMVQGARTDKEGMMQYHTIIPSNLTLLPQ